MKLLLDTNHLLFVVQEPEKLSKKAATLLSQPGTDLLISTVSLWEIAIKNRASRSDGSSRLPLPDGFRPFEHFAADTGATMLPLHATHIQIRLSVEPPHGDPFDYVLLQQAQAEGATLLTSDRKLRGHPLVTYTKPA